MTDQELLKRPLTRAEIDAATAQQIRAGSALSARPAELSEFARNLSADLWNRHEEIEAKRREP